MQNNGTIVKLLLAGLLIFVLYRLFKPKGKFSSSPLPYDDDEDFEEEDSDDEGYEEEDSDDEGYEEEDSDEEGYEEEDSDDEGYEEEEEEEGYGPMDQNYGTLSPSATAAALASARPDLPGVNLASDLLPKPAMTQTDFAEFAPKSLSASNFVDATAWIGVDTQGSSLKNANYQLRADIPIPRSSVGPWMNSTITAGDLSRKSVE